MLSKIGGFFRKGSPFLAKRASFCRRSRARLFQPFLRAGPMVVFPNAMTGDAGQALRQLPKGIYIIKGKKVRN